MAASVIKCNNKPDHLLVPWGDSWAGCKASTVGRLPSSLGLLPHYPLLGSLVSGGGVPGWEAGENFLIISFIHDNFIGLFASKYLCKKKFVVSFQRHTHTYHTHGPFFVLYSSVHSSGVAWFLPPAGGGGEGWRPPLVLSPYKGLHRL